MVYLFKTLSKNENFYNAAWLSKAHTLFYPHILGYEFYKKKLISIPRQVLILSEIFSLRNDKNITYI